MRTFQQVEYLDASMRICTTRMYAAMHELVNQRDVLDRYVSRRPEFKAALEPLAVLPSPAPKVAQAMHQASLLTGVGPMAAVAGAMAQRVANAALRIGAKEAIVENGGDIFMHSPDPVFVGLVDEDEQFGAGIAQNLAFRVVPERMPLAICSSSSTMGHSLSLGECDLATVVSADAALADAAATLACNLVKELPDVQGALERVGSIDGVCGVLVIKGGHLGVVGDLPEIVKNEDNGTMVKVTRYR